MTPIQSTRRDYLQGGAGPACYTRPAETVQKIGAWILLSGNLPKRSNRVQLTCPSEFNTCPGQSGSSDLRTALRSSRGSEPPGQGIRPAIALNPGGRSTKYSLAVPQGVMRPDMNFTGV